MSCSHEWVIDEDLCLHKFWTLFHPFSSFCCFSRASFIFSFSFPMTPFPYLSRVYKLACSKFPAIRLEASDSLSAFLCLGRRKFYHLFDGDESPIAFYPMFGLSLLSGIQGVLLSFFPGSAAFFAGICDLPLPRPPSVYTVLISISAFRSLIWDSLVLASVISRLFYCCVPHPVPSSPFILSLNRFSSSSHHLSI